MARLLAALLSVCCVPAQQRPPSEIQKAVEEFRTQTRALGVRADSPRRAQRSRSARSGWHGRVFENFRNDFLDAVPHEIRQRGGKKSLLRRNQFGFNVSGPVYVPGLFHGGRNTFFSLSYEGVRERISRSYLRTIATLPERSGDFSALVDSAGAPLPVFDPGTTRPNPVYDPARPVSAANLQYLRDPFPANRIPAARLDPVALRIVRYYPQPNADAGPFFRNNFFVVSPETNTAGGMIGKVDHNLGERNKVAFGFSFSNGFAGAARLYPNPADPGNADRDFSSRRYSAEHILTLSPRTVHSASFEAVSDVSDLSHGPEADYLGEIGLRGGLGARVFPVVRISPYLGFGDTTPNPRYVRNTFILSNSLSARRGRHNLRFSGRIIRYQVHAFTPTYPAGSARFTAGLTSLPGIVNTGHPFASFMLGLPDFGEISVVESPSYFRRGAGTASFRESFEAAQGLTFAVSVNLDVNTPRVEKYDRQTTVDLSVINPANGRPGALIAAGRNGAPRGFRPVIARLEPGASVSWSPRGNPSTVLRLSFGRSYSAVPIYSSQWGTQGFTGSPIFLSRNAQLEPAFRLSQGYPATPPMPDLRPEAANDTIADLAHRGAAQPTYQSASFSVERALPGALIVTAGAYMSGGKNLLVGSSAVNLNAIPLAALSYRDLLNTEAFSRALRPYPQYRGFDLYSQWPAGRYHRNTGFLRAEKRGAQGLTLSASYEWSKQMDDYSGPYGAQDFFNRRNEWSLTRGSNPHRVSMTFSYELPIGPNKPFLGFNDWRRYLAGGWSVSGISALASGEPLALRPEFNNTGGVIQALRVNVVPGVDPRVRKPSPELWFNPAAFDQPPDFTLGNGPRTHPFLRGPRSQNHDLSVVKRFSLSTDRTLELSAMGLNFLNHANWNDPDVEIGPASSPNVNAGRIIGSRGGRVMQLGLRFSF